MSTTKKGNRYIFFILIIFILGSMSFQILLSPYEESFNLYQKVLTDLLGQALIFLPLIIYIISTAQKGDPTTPLPTKLLSIAGHFKEVLKLNRISLFTIFLLITLGFMMQPLTYFLNLFSQLYSSNKIGNYLTDVAQLPYWFLLICFAVVPAINEELTLRGLLLFHYKHVPPIKTALVSGLFFGILHLNLNQFTYAFFMGTIFAIVVYITNSIFSSIILHFIINGTSITMLKGITVLINSFPELFGKELLDTKTISSAQIFSMLPTALLIAVPFGFIVYALLYLLAKEHDKLDLFKKVASTETIPFYKNTYSKIIDPYFILLIIVFIGMQVYQYIQL